MIDKTLKLEKFKKWLEAKDKDRLIGIPSYSTICPISVYLYTKGYDDFYVTTSKIKFDNKEQEDLPEWAIDFTHKSIILIENNLANSRWASELITVGECLRIINEIETGE